MNLHYQINLLISQTGNYTDTLDILHTYLKLSTHTELKTK